MGVCSAAFTPMPANCACKRASSSPCALLVSGLSPIEDRSSPTNSFCRCQAEECLPTAFQPILKELVLHCSLCGLGAATLQDVPSQVAAAGAALCGATAGNTTAAASTAQLCQAAQHFAVTGTLGFGAGIDVNATVDQNAGAAIGVSWQLASTQADSVSILNAQLSKHVSCLMSEQADSWP